MFFFQSSLKACQIVFHCGCLSVVFLKEHTRESLKRRVPLRQPESRRHGGAMQHVLQVPVGLRVLWYTHQRSHTLDFPIAGNARSTCNKCVARKSKAYLKKRRVQEAKQPEPDNLCAGSPRATKKQRKQPTVNDDIEQGADLLVHLAVGGSPTSGSPPESNQSDGQIRGTNLKGESGFEQTTFVDVIAENSSESKCGNGSGYSAPDSAPEWQVPDALCLMGRYTMSDWDRWDMSRPMGPHFGRIC